MKARGPRCSVVVFTGIALLVGGAPPRAAVQSSQAALTIERLTSLPNIAGTPPANLAWAPDSRTLAFVWNDRGMRFRDVWVASVDDAKPRRLTDLAASFPEPPVKGGDPDETLVKTIAARSRTGVSDVTWSPDGTALVFVYSGDLFRVGADGAGLERLTHSPEDRSEIAFSPDGAFLAWLQDGDLWLWNQKTNQISRATDIGAPALSRIPLARYTLPDVEVSSYDWSPNGRYVALQLDDRSQVRKILLPDFLRPETEARWVRRDFPGDHDHIRALAILGIQDGRMRTVELADKRDRRISNFGWSPDGSQLLVDQNSENAVHRWIFVVDPQNASFREIWHDERATRTTQFWNSTWRGDGEAVLFVSDHDGRHHLYSIPAAGGSAKQLTSGEWSVVSPGFGGASLTVSPQTRQVFFVSTKKNPAERQVYRMPDVGGAVTQLTTLEGTHLPTVAPDGRTVALMHSSDTAPPEVYLVDGKTAGAERRVTNSPTEEFSSFRWVEPQYVTFKSRTDGATLHGRLVLPPQLDKSRQYPVVLGPVYAFTVRNQWRGAYSLFEQFMTIEGQYIGLQVDVRGSSGYGREFREQLLGDYGGIDVEDLHSGVEYLKTLPYVDPDRIGIWGWSYGGLMTAMSLFKKPGVYKAGVAGAPATNVWHATTGEVHVTGLPNVAPDVFRKTSAFTFAEGLQDPLMIIHGVLDDIVLFRDSAALAEKLMMLGKNFDFVVLPSSTHSAIGKDYVARHVFTKIAEHFERHLGKGPTEAGRRISQ